MAHQKYSKYKNSGIEWLGDIPEHWERPMIKRICKVKRGASPRPIDNPIYFDEKGEFAWVRIADVTKSNTFLKKTQQKLSNLGSSKSVKIYPEDIFLSIAGSVGKPIITKIKCCIHDGFVYFENLNLNKKYFFYIFLSKQPYRGLGKMGTQLNLNTATVGSIVIPLPPKSEQTAIANYLDQKLEKINAFITKKKQLITLLEEQKAAIINDAVTKGLDKTVAMKDSGVEWLGDIPEHWEVRKLKYATEVLRGKFTPRPRNNPKYYDGNYPFIQTGNIASANKYIKEYNQTLNELGREVSKEFPTNSIVMSIAANIADVAILTFNACFPDSVLGFKVYENTNVDFLFYQLKNLRSEFFKIAIKSTQYNLNVDRVKNVKVFLPPKPEQQKIVQHIETATKKIDRTIRTIQKELDLVSEYKTALIAEAVTGKIRIS